MPTSGTWKVPFRGKFGAYDYAGDNSQQQQQHHDSPVVLARRLVPPFSVQSLQRDTRVRDPPRCHATRARVDGQPTAFRRYIPYTVHSTVQARDVSTALFHRQIR